MASNKNGTDEKERATLLRKIRKTDGYKDINVILTEVVEKESLIQQTMLLKMNQRLSDRDDADREDDFYEELTRHLMAELVKYVEDKDLLAVEEKAFLMFMVEDITQRLVRQYRNNRDAIS